MKNRIEEIGEAAILRGRRATSVLPGNWGRRLRETAKWTVNYKGARGTARRAWSFARAGRRSDLLVAPFGDGQLLVDATDEEIGRVVYMRGDYEREYMRVALDFLATRPDGNQRGSTLVDVGANIGTTTIDGLLHFGFGRAVCFEPDPRNVRLLRMNLLLNDLAERATVIPAAASDTDDVVVVEHQAGNFGDSRVATSSTSDGITVPSVRIDSQVAAGTIDVRDVGLVWIDAQGHDPRVLAGATSLTGPGVPIVVEYWPDGLGDGADRDLLEQIVAQNYRTVVDLRVAASGRGEPEFAAAEIGGLRRRYVDHEHTDLLLLR